MLRAVCWAVYGLVPIAAVVVLAPLITLPKLVTVEVESHAVPYAGTVSPDDMAAAFTRCTEFTDPSETFVMGPAWRREDGRLLITGISQRALLACTLNGSGINRSGMHPTAPDSVRDHPFDMYSATSYEDRPGGTLVGYAGTDVASLNFRTPDGRVVPAVVREGVFILELPVTPEYEYEELTHEAFDVNGVLIAGR